MPALPPLTPLLRSPLSVVLCSPGLALPRVSPTTPPALEHRLPPAQPGSELQLRPATPPWTHRVYNLSQTHPVSTGFLPSALLAAPPSLEAEPQFCWHPSWAQRAPILWLTCLLPSALCRSPLPGQWLSLPGSSSCPRLSLHPSDRPEPSAFWPISPRLRPCAVCPPLSAASPLHTTHWV